jgi:hypothetical protein
MRAIERSEMALIGQTTAIEYFRRRSAHKSFRHPAHLGAISLLSREAGRGARLPVDRIAALVEESGVGGHADPGGASDGPEFQRG